MSLKNYLQKVGLFLSLFLLTNCMDSSRKKPENELEAPTNSFEKQYKKKNPTLRYSYDEKQQIHNYSYNWDFDGDGKKDQLYFVGNKGAHLYYFLRIGVSSEDIITSFPTVESDFPFLPSEKEFSKKDFDPVRSHAYFAVGDFNKDSVADIFLQIDKIPGRPSKGQKLEPFNYLFVSFKGGKLHFKNFEKLNEPVIEK